MREAEQDKAGSRPAIAHGGRSGRSGGLAPAQPPVMSVISPAGVTRRIYQRCRAE